jgi:acyl transferase domain-containing protein/acyl carrier protein
MTADGSEQAEEVSREEQSIAIVGIGCRLPAGVDGPRSLWRALLDRTDGIVDVPADRWDNRRFYDSDPTAIGRTYARQAGFLRDSVFEFDAEFFGISPREAAILDPQQRLLLETTWEALEDAGTPLATAQASHTGMYVGAFCFDNMVDRFAAVNRAEITSSTATSGSMVMLSNRVSHALDLNGPSLTMDTACSSSLVAVHLACRGLLDGDCDLAFAAGVNVMLRPENAIAMAKGGFLSPTCRCHAFDASADGYVRGEGAAVVLLKPLRNALADGDRVYATILATGVNQDGHTATGISVPNGAAQRRLIRDVWTRAGIRADDISYIEAHGTGTQTGDPIEAGALGAALYDAGQDARESRQVWLGSIKTNFGHLEAGAGVLGLIKAALVLQHRTVPPNLHFEHPNPGIDFGGLGLVVPTGPQPLDPLRPHHAAVNSFGYGGTNAHAVLRSVANDGAGARPDGRRGSRAASGGPILVPVSARNEAALARVEAATGAAARTLGLGDLGATLATRRTHHRHRAAVWAESPADLAQKLTALSAGERVVGSARGVVTRQRRILFVYTGMGVQSEGMGSGLFAAYPVFRDAIAAVDETYRECTGESLVAFFASTSGTGAPLKTPLAAQPTNLAIQVGLTSLWRDFGFLPDAVIGHSVGEIAAGWAAGALSLAEAVRISMARCGAQEALAGRGSMLAVGLSAADARRYLGPSTGSVSIAAYNGPESVALAGTHQELTLLAARLDKDGVFNRRLMVDVAYHHAQQDEVAEQFHTTLGSVAHTAPTLPLYSTTRGGLITGAELDAGYWWDNVREPVQFEPALSAALTDGCDLSLEVGPHRTLSAAIAATARKLDRPTVTVASMQRASNESLTFRTAGAELGATGRDPDWARVQPGGGHVDLPAYPWQRMPMWQASDATVADRIVEPLDPLLHQRLATPEAEWLTEPSPGFLPYLRDHVVAGATLFPASGYIAMALAAGASTGRGNAIENLRLDRALTSGSSAELRLRLDELTGEFAFFGRQLPDPQWQRTGGGRLAAAPPSARPVELAELTGALAEVDVSGLYDGLARRTLSYGPAFRAVTRAWQSEREVVAELKLPPAAAPGGLVHPVLLDAAFHSLFAADAAERGGPAVPVSVGRVRVHAALPARVWSHGHVRETTARGFEADLVLRDDSGTPLVEVERLRCQTLAVPVADRGVDTYVERWVAASPPTGPADPVRHWLVTGDDPEVVDAVLSSLRARGCNAQRAQDADGVIDGQGERGVVIVAGQPSADAPSLLAGVIETLACLQRMPRTPRAPGRTLLVTRGAFDPSLTHSPALAAIWGAGRVAQNETPELDIRLVDIGGPAEIDALVVEALSTSRETEVRLEAGRRSVRRVEAVAEPTPTPATVSATDVPVRLAAARTRGIDGLHWQRATRLLPGPGQVEIHARYVPVNFKDLMKVMGLLTEDYLAATYFTTALGMEVAGTVTRVGPGVTDFQAGDEVVGPVGGFASYATVSTRFLVPKPRPLTLAQAPILINAMTAIHALTHLARLQPGERVLITSGAGGVGLHAIAHAQRLGGEIFATAGSEDKRQLLRGHGVDHVFDSRSLSFADEILERTDGVGVDVVVNSASGEALRRSWEVLAPYGRFVEIGKRDIVADTRLGMARFDENRSFMAMDLDRMLLDRPDHFRRLELEACKALDDGTLPALPTAVFPAADVVDAFRTMARGKHTGKLVVSLDGAAVELVAGEHREPLFHRNRSYLVTGGLGGFGRSAARWLAASGAGDIVLVGRRTHELGDLAAEIEALGARVTAIAADVSNPEDVDRLLCRVADRHKPLAGVFHAAMVLEDALLQDVQAGALRRVLAPKATGAWNLHEQTRSHPLDHFVLFSSVSGLLGNPGQAAYAAANSYLDALARHRRHLGLPALSVQWGAIDDVGVVANMPGLREHLSRHGIQPIGSGVALATLERALRAGRDVVCLADIDWPTWAPLSPIAAAPRFSAVTRELTTRSDPRELLATRLRQLAEPAGRLETVEGLIRAVISRVIRLPGEMISADKSLRDMGADSLMSVELAVEIERDTGVGVSSGLLMQGPTLRDLTNHVLADLELTATGGTTPADVDLLTDEEAEGLLASLIDAGAIDVDEALSGSASE